LEPDPTTLNNHDDLLVAAEMPAIRSARNRKPPPDGFEDLEDTLLEFSNKMKDAENASHEGKKKQEMLWPVFQITHQRKSPKPLAPPTHTARITVHLRAVLREGSDIEEAVRLAAEERLCGRQPDRQVEEAGL
jgi:bud site selection protein 31